MATREELDITWGDRIKQFENFYSTHHSVIFGRNEFYDIISTKEFPTNKSVLCNWCEYKSKCPEFTKQSLQEFL